MALKTLLIKLAEKFAENNICYVIIGDVALLVYGVPRLTYDIDITLGADIHSLPLIINIIKELNMEILVKDPEGFVRRTMVLPSFHKETQMRVDFIFSYSEYERQAIKRCVKIKINDHYINYASVEDLIIHKVIAGRPRDIDDIKSLLVRHKKINERYIRKWLKEFSHIIGEDLVTKFIAIKKEVKS